MRISVSRLVAPLCLAASLTAQSPPSVLHVQASYHVGTFNVQVAGPHSPGSTDLIGSQQGQLTLRNDLTHQLATTRHEVYPNQSTSTSPDNDSGTYAVDPSSLLVLDWNPSTPGSDTDELLINRDATMIVGARRVADPESFMLIGLQVSTGQSNASLNGRYYLVSEFFEYDSTGLISGASRGVATLNGTGGFAFTGQEQRVDASGASSLNNVGGTGAYTVGADGSFSLSPTEIGGISPNGDVFFTVILDPNGTEVGMTVGVRIGATYTMDMLAGSYRFAGHEVELGNVATLPFVFSEGGVLDLAAQSITTGSYSGSAVWVESDPTLITAGTDAFAGTATLGPDGAVTLTDPGSPNEPVVLHFSQGGDAAVGTTFFGLTDMFLAIEACGGSELFGTPTAGTGGIAPATSMRGWPELGSTTFALRIANGRGGAAAVMPIAWAPSPGIPFLGGMVWFDPTQVIAAPSLAMSGAAGAPGAGEGTLPLALPSTPSLAGVRLFAQGFVLDPNAPAGLAMTEGLAIGFCR